MRVDITFSLSVPTFTAAATVEDIHFISSCYDSSLSMVLGQTI
jgi:hypothetical protein